MALPLHKRAHFELIGPAAVKREMAEGEHGQPPDSPNWLDASAWVESEMIRQTLSASAKRDEQEERTLAIADEALSIAKEANRIASEDLEAARSSAAAAERQARWAMYAAVIAVIAAAMSIKVQIKALILWLL